ncbi:hypothetical protein ACJX0J_040779, partial [Zea mays]
SSNPLVAEHIFVLWATFWPDFLKQQLLVWFIKPKQNVDFFYHEHFLVEIVI